MRILKIEFENIGLFENGFMVDFVARDRVTDKNYVYNYDNNFHTLNTLALIGANATGKTSALQLVSMAFEVVLKQEALKNLLVPRGLIHQGSIMSVDFYDAESQDYYRLKSEFDNINSADHGSDMQSLKYAKETLYKKKASQVKKKEQTTQFEEKDVVSTREALKGEVNFLRDDDSILFYLIKRNENTPQVTSISLINENMMNFYRVSGKAAMLDIHIFDDSIDALKLDDSQIKVKFKNKSDELACSNVPNQNYLLSSGTAKGGNVLFWLKGIIRNGGYLIIDELENHFHKRLVQFVIDLFNDEEINRKGATLIFTTHYTEILDSIERKDNIFVLTRNKDYICEVVRYSDVVKRIENKKSEVFLSNYIKGTSPTYGSIQAFKESIWK